MNYPETEHARDCLYVTSGGPATCTCGAVAVSPPDPALEAAQYMLDCCSYYTKEEHTVARALLAAAKDAERMREALKALAEDEAVPPWIGTLARAALEPKP